METKLHWLKDEQMRRPAGAECKPVAASIFVCLCLCLSPTAPAQTSAPPARDSGKPMRTITVRAVPPRAQAPKQAASSTPKQPVPLAHLYWHFLMYQNHLDRAAVLHEQQGKNGAWLRDHFQKRLAFTDAQFTAVRAAAQRLEPKLKAIRGEAMAVVQSDRKITGVPMPAGGPPVPSGFRDVNQAPPGRARLHELQLQHEAAITAEVAKLKQDLGPEASAKLESFLQNDWSRQVTVTRFKPPANNMPFRTPPRPFVQGVHP